MATASDKNVFGRMRQRIVTVGRVDPKRGVLTRGRAAIARDRLLRALLRSGSVTHGQLEAAISGVARMPSNFTWLTVIDLAVLEKADRVFFAKYGRAPVNDQDFLINGDYHKICRSLQFDMQRYDSQLEEVPGVDRPVGQAQVEEPRTSDRDRQRQIEKSEVRSHANDPVRPGRQEPKTRGIWPFVAVLVLGFGSAPVMAIAIATYFSGQNLLVGLAIGTFWLLALLGALVLTLPRRAT